MSKVNKDLLLSTAATLFAQEGMVSFSIRGIATQLKIAPSLIYYYFKNEDELLFAMFLHLNKQLGQLRSQLPACTNASQMLKQQLFFQFEHQSSIVAVLKYYLKFRKKFKKYKDGFLPNKSALHMEEIVRFGIESGEFISSDIEGDAKFITHAVNGYLLEFYPHVPTEKEKTILVDQMYSFISRGMRKQ